MTDPTSAGASDPSAVSNRKRKDVRIATVQEATLHPLVEELPWKLLPTKDALPRVDLRQGTNETTFFVDPVTRAKAEAVLSSLYDELSLRSPRPDWVPADCLSKRTLICIILRVISRHDLLTEFVDNGITDVDIPIDMPTLRSFLKDTKTIELFHDVQYNAKLRDLEEDGLALYRDHEILPFRTIRSLGHGGFATVDCVQHVLRGYEVAHKAFILTPRLERRMQDSFETEIRSLKKLSGHRHVVEYLGAYRSPHCLGLLLRPVAECDMYQFLKSPGSFNIANWRGLLRQSFGCLSSALAFMHEKKIRHKDIKGQNVLLKKTSTGTNLLFTDFGIAMDFSTIARSTTEGPQPLKTERYCAPEVAGGRERGRRSDVYSLGCLFVEVATVMLGFDLQALDDELGGDGVFHESAFQLSNWVSRLTRDAEEDDAAIVNWIPPMIHKHPGSRPQMQKVVDDMLEDTRAYKELRGQLFCDLCTNEMREMKMISTLTTGVKALDLQEDSDYEFDPEGWPSQAPDVSGSEGQYMRQTSVEPDLELFSETDSEDVSSRAERTFIDVSSIPRLRAGSVMSVVQVYISLVDCLQCYNILANLSGLWSITGSGYLRRRLDFELLRLLNWGFTVGLCRGGPLQPSELESVSHQEIILKNLEQQRKVFESCLDEYRMPIEVLRKRDADFSESRRIPALSRSLLRSLLFSIITRSPQVESTQVSSEKYNDVTMIATLGKLEDLNEQLRTLLDPSTLELLLEKDAETSLELLQLSVTLEDITDLIRAVQPGRHTDDSTDAGVIDLLAKVSTNTSNSNRQGLGTRGAIAQFARFKALNMMVETYSGNLWEAVKQAAADPPVYDLVSYAWGSDKHSTIDLSSKDVSLFDDELDLDDVELAPVTGFCRTGRGKNKQKRLVWIEWKNYDEYDADDGPTPRIVARIRKLALLLNDPEKPKEFRVPHCLGYFIYDEANKDIGPCPIGLVFAVPSNVPANGSFLPISLLEVMALRSEVAVLVRLELALKVASCVLYFHSVNWLHKGLRGRSIMFFPDSSGTMNLVEPIVSGFDYSRPAKDDAMTERPMDNTSEDIYRHPDVQATGNRDDGSGRRGGFRKVYDIYSLGVVLVEIGCWQDISAILNIDLPTARPKHTWVVRDRLLREENVSERVSNQLSSEYWDVCKACIQGATAFGLETDSDENRPIVAATLQAGFYRKVVRRLKYLVKGSSNTLRT